MAVIRIVDIVDRDSFGLVPPCADPGFDHRSCDYWEDADRGSKAARSSWLETPGGDAARDTDHGRARPGAVRPRNPFADDEPAEAPVNPFAAGAGSAPNPFAPDGGGEAFNPFAPGAGSAPNPFAPPPRPRPTVGPDVPRKLSLLARGISVFGSYAKVLLLDEEPVAYAQFGPLSAYPRAQRLRDLYPQLPPAPLPAVITCIATTPEARRAGHALLLVEAVCDDLAGRGFSAVEAYPEAGARLDATSAATVDFWGRAGFDLAVDDDRFPVVRRELA
jgi:GNAT superfamily N-acetyltransferase